MKIGKIGQGGRSAAAVIAGNRVHVIGDWIEGDPYAAPFVLPAMTVTDLAAAAAASHETLALDDVALLSPAGPLAKLICLGLNYKNHVAEVEGDLPPYPSLFIKVADALVGHDAPIVRPRVSEQFDYEGEIAVIIGSGGRHIARDDALGHVFGYAIMLDGSVRDFQKEHSVSSGKNFWHSGAFGPWIVTADEIPDCSLLKLETRLNGQTVQSTTADLMIYDIPTAISYISSWTTLAAGDVIATGTPGGVGSRRTPPLWMRDGDRIEVEVSGIGVLANTVEDEVW